MKINQIYLQKIELFEKELKDIKKLLFTSSMLRLAVFLLTIIGVYFLWGNLQWILVEVLIGVVLFFMLVSRHVKLQQKRNRLEALIQINQIEVEVLQGNYAHLPDGEKYQNPVHEFSHDIDLFGRKSFYQYLNRTSLFEGEQKLVEMLTNNHIDQIEIKQQAIEDLKEKIDFRQEFSAFALLSQEEDHQDVRKNLRALQTHEFFTPKYAVLLSWIFSGFSIALITAYFMDFIPMSGLVLWLLIGTGISGIYFKRVNLLSDKVSKMQKTFRQYYRLLKLIEDHSFSSEIMIKNKNQISSEGKKASEVVKEFSKTIDSLDQRANILFGFFGNGFLLWDLRYARKLENWLNQHIDKVDQWFDVIALTDAYNSLGNFAFNHPDYVFPTITHSQTILNVKDAVHPLIPEEEAVTNDVKIDREEFLIVTGANMAGKSTFLRTISLQILMSNMGLPVRASFCEYTPVKLITSMRTVDSLAEESSYFYAELSRLKFIIDKLKKDDYFIVLDEILKGTNSKDKAIGSKKFVKKLVNLHSTGIIATHDLSLCEITDELPQVRNHFFDAQIIDDELYFDYKFKEGICQNMNASFLLRKMQIVDE